MPVIVLLLLLMVFFAWWSAMDPLDESGGQAPGIVGTPGGASDSGSGSGADAAGSGPSVTAANPDENPRGDAGTPVDQAEVVASGNDAKDTVRTLPRIGFTAEEEVKVASSPVSPVLAAKGGSGRGGSGGAAGSSGTEFMGIRSDGSTIVYILDFSGSMFGQPNGNPKIDNMLLELKRSINRLPPDHDFYIIFFDDDALPMGGTRMIAATAGNKAQWFAWADKESVGTDSGGGTAPGSALEFALKNLKPETIYLLTDGGFEPSEPFRIITQYNSDGKTQINTIGLHDRSNEMVMRKIARDNRGEYRYIPPPQP